MLAFLRDRKVRDIARELADSESFEPPAGLLEKDWGIAANVWSVTSFTELRRDGIEVERHNMLHPLSEQRNAYVTDCLRNRRGPVIASTDYLRAFADQIRQWVPDHYRVLGTDGFGRSDTREALRRYFEVDDAHIVVAVLAGLAAAGEISHELVMKAIRDHGIDPDTQVPWTG